MQETGGNSLRIPNSKAWQFVPAHGPENTSQRHSVKRCDDDYEAATALRVNRAATST
jgi:hypothetical protein